VAEAHDRCGAVEPLLSACMDGELTARDHQRVQSHVDACTACAAEVEQLIVVRSLVRSLPVRQLPAGVRATLGEHGPARHEARPATRVAATAAVALGLLSGVVFSLGGQPPADTRTVAVPMDVYVADHVVHSVQSPVGSPVLVGLRR
jgi:anti-sigma factor RsiW